jgi:hypothetical protein
VKPEHAQIVAQPQITFDQFMQYYLPTGEVWGLKILTNYEFPIFLMQIDKIIYYPQKRCIVALIRPDALINGEPVKNVGLNSSFNLAESSL